MLSMVCFSAVHFQCFVLNFLPKGLTGKKEGKTRLMNMVMQVCVYVANVGYHIQHHVSSGK